MKVRFESVPKNRPVLRPEARKHDPGGIGDGTQPVKAGGDAGIESAAESTPFGAVLPTC
jgi:hypothetical protein